ncbi:helix-turn-helix transcriptional regulator [Kocuria palustris]|jgi:predicted DNA-binding transcriptional regulator AlpA|uniref:helix-turn-helix transcriptional regulator n=1 Tax=Kocuria palustris TaxID=71999 RepID=UPI001DD02367|nr:helix-turn-helix domain-containing protein [Kocuria palustris]MBZ6376592.1 helix-turn-helix domain-containing protein [Kocuria palustris]
MTEQETFLTMQDVADRYGVALQTVRGWRMTGYGPKGFKVGRLVRYPLDEVRRFEQELMAEASA